METMIRIYKPDEDQPDADTPAKGSNAIVGPDISVTELLMQLEQSLFDADAEIKDEEESVERVA